MSANGMKKEDKSSVPVSHDTRERLNHVKYDYQAKYHKQCSLDDTIRLLLDEHDKK